MPQYPSVWPKSSGFCSNPIGVDTSINPARPKVELNTTRAALVRALSTLPCNRLLTAERTSPRLLKKLLTPSSARSGITKRYPWASGLTAYLSICSLKVNMARLNPCQGSAPTSLSSTSACAGTASAAARTPQTTLRRNLLISIVPTPRQLSRILTLLPSG